MKRPSFVVIALVVLAALSCYQSFSPGELQGQLDSLRTSMDKLKPAVSSSDSKASPIASAPRSDRSRPQSVPVQPAATLPSWLIERKREEMFQEMRMWESNGKLNSRVLELAGFSEGQTSQLEQLKKSAEESRRKVPVFPPEILESSPKKIVIQMEKEDQAVVEQLYQDHVRAVDAVVGADFDPLIRERLPHQGRTRG